MQDPTAPVVPPITLTKPMPRSHTLRLIILGAIALIIVAALAYFWKDISNAVALKEVQVAEAQYRDIHIKKFTVLGVKEYELKTESAVGDYAHNAGTEVAIVGTTEGPQDIIVLSDGGRALTSDGVRKAALAVSADGTKVAYAALTNPREGATFDLNMARWTVRIADVATGETQELGEGFGPEFFVRDGISYLLFTAPTQIALYDIGKNVVSGINFFTLGSVDYAGHISADGTRLAIRSGVTGMFDIFSVESVAQAITLKPLGTVGVQLTDVQWNDDTLYGLTDTFTLVSIDPTDLAHPKTLSSLASDVYYRFIR